MLRQADIPFEEACIPLYRPDSAAALAKWSPSGFSALREHMSMSIRARRPGKGRTPESLADVERILSIWNADAVLALPALKAWVADALAETARIEMYEFDE